MRRNVAEGWDQYRCLTVDAGVRERVSELLHISLDDPADRWLWRMVDYLLWGTWRDEDSRRLVLAEGRLRAICGLKSRVTVHERLATFMERTGATIEIWRPQYSFLGKANEVERVNWGANNRAIHEIQRSVRRTTTKLADRVFFDTGKRASAALQSEARRSSQRECLEAMAEVTNPDAKRLLHYLNNLPSHRWTTTAEHLPDLRALAVTEQHPEHALDILRRAEDSHPQPFYTVGERSSRIHAVGGSILYVQRSIRKALVRRMGWKSFDLRASQLAILSVAWNVPELFELLRSGRSVWDEMLADLGWGAEDKDTLKRGIYQLAYGAGAARLKALFVGRSSATGLLDYKRWRANPLIASLWRARSREKKRIEAAGGAADCYGRWYEITERRPKERNRQVRSILACIAQARELHLIAPALEVVEGSDRRVQMSFWLHDGFAVSCPKSLDYVCDQIVAAVNARCREAGIPTELVEEN